METKQLKLRAEIFNTKFRPNHLMKTEFIELIEDIILSELCQEVSEINLNDQSIKASELSKSSSLSKTRKQNNRKSVESKESGKSSLIYLIADSGDSKFPNSNIGSKHFVFKYGL